MPLVTMLTIIAYAAILCSIPMLRSAFLPHEWHVLFWVLLVEHLVMIPLSIAACMVSLKETPRPLSFCIGSLVTAAVLFFVFLTTISGASDRGMGVIILLIFPLIDAVVAVAGILGGVVYIAKKVESAGRKSAS